MDLRGCTAGGHCALYRRDTQQGYRSNFEVLSQTRLHAMPGSQFLHFLGNFVFDGFLAPSNYSAIFTATLSLHGVDSYSWVPVMVEHGLPRLRGEGQMDAPDSIRSALTVPRD